MEEESIVSKAIESANNDELAYCKFLAPNDSGETGAHQLYNHTDEPCTYLDLRSFIGHDVCEYPDSGKLILMPTAETLCKDEQHAYFEGEQGVDTIWNRLSRQ